jgi:hypothetical protein
MTGVPGTPAAVAQTLQRLVHEAPSYAQLDPATQNELVQAVDTVARYLASDPAQTLGAPLARQLAPDLRGQIGARPGQPPPPPAGQPAPPGTPPAAGGGGGGTVGRVGDVARATLNAIDFPQFVASLIQGTFQAIVDASIQQMEAYAELLRNVAGTVDRFMRDNITEGVAKDYLADQYPGVLSRDVDGNRAVLRPNDAAADGEMPSFFRDLGFETPQDLDERAIDEVVVPAARRTLAEQRQQTLATMVLMGINRVVVDDGEILAKLQFHIDASEATQLRFDQTKTTTGNIAGQAGRNPFSAQALLVNTASVNAQTDINVRADLTGQVKVKFRSETFPLERFADSPAIQLINNNARVPEAPPPPPAPGAPAAPGAPGVPAPAVPAPPAPPVAPAPAPPPAPRPATPVQQGLGDAAGTGDGRPYDPWEPES